MMSGMLIFAGLSLFILFVLYLTNRTGEKINGNLFLGVTLPRYALENKVVAAVGVRYHKAQVRCLLVFALFLLPYLKVGEFISISIFYCTLWCILLFTTNQIVINKYFSELHWLKMQNNWHVSNRHILRVDTEVSRLKHKFIVSKYWFLLPLLISAGTAIILWFIQHRHIVPWIMALSGLVTALISFVIYLIYLRARTVVYSQNTEINLALNACYRREWSKCWVGIALLHSVMFALVVGLMISDHYDNRMIVILLSISCAFTLLLILQAYHKIRAEKNLLMQVDQEIIYVDEDQYWEKGYYYNPNDRRNLVEKRWGYGMSVNLARPIGKITMAATLLSIAFAVWIGIFLMPLDFGSISLAVSEDEITISAPMETYSFQTGDIRHISIIEDFPSWSKKSGGDSPRFLVGTFRVSGYGQSSVYVNRNCAPYIVIDLKAGQVFLNGASEKETEEMYERLQDILL